MNRRIDSSQGLLPVWALLLLLAGLISAGLLGPSPASAEGAGAVQSAEEPTAAFGLHGMLLFGGREALFASHLPMFHAPHDTQVVLRIQLEEAMQQTLGEALSHEPRLWTLVPERFDLMRLAPGAANPIRHFRADVFVGHFERGGRQRHRQVEVTVEAVLVFHRLDPAMRLPERLEYLRIAASPNAREQFLALKIDARPSADHVLAIEPESARLPERLLLEPDAGVFASATALESALIRLGARQRAQLHLETDDLK